MKKQLFITGGIGNQMSEYAFYLSCIKKGIRIDLNIDLYHVNRMHNGYMLNRAFGVSNDIVRNSNRLTVLCSRLLRRYLPFGLVYNEIYDVFSDEAYYGKAPYINGVFIGERYFEDAREEVRKAFIFKNIDSENLRLASLMQETSSVSLHIRRGDYLKIPQYAVCDEQYYSKAIRYVNDHVEKPKFFVFSDDPAWCQTFLKRFEIDFHVVNRNFGIDSYKDMFLMTQCKHNIIANSTFSWWGAWLNNNSNKIVVCPEKWIIGRIYNPCLKEWVRA